MSAGFWLPHTGSPDWCEKNYAWTIYIAEFWNTLTSVPLALAGVWGLYQCYKYKFAIQFVLCNLVLMFVGFGSVAFHGSLSYAGQCMDELAMIYCALTFAYTLGGAGRQLGAALFAYAAAFTYVYFHLKSSVYFQVFVVMYALSIAILAWKSYQFAILSSSPQLLRLIKVAASVYIGGFLFLWIPEHVLCIIPTTDTDRPPIIEAAQVKQLL